MGAQLLEGAVALVTGGAAGIGASITRCFAVAGATVIIADVDDEGGRAVARELVDEGHAASAVPADVRDEAAVEAVVDAVARTHGRLDVLVNNVGHFLGSRADFEATTDAQWDALHEINLRSVMVCTRAALPLLRSSDRASVINLTTIEAFRGVPGLAVYGAYKAAVTHLTRSLAVELGATGIRVNAIAPDKIDSVQTAYSTHLPPDVLADVGRWIPLGRLGRPEDAAGPALFLASELSAFITGTTVHVDGGIGAAGGWTRTADGAWTNLPGAGS